MQLKVYSASALRLDGQTVCVANWGGRTRNININFGCNYNSLKVVYGDNCFKYQLVMINLTIPTISVWK
jgi:hypothetical protein